MHKNIPSIAILASKMTKLVSVKRFLGRRSFHEENASETKISNCSIFPEISIPLAIRIIKAGYGREAEYMLSIGKPENLWAAQYHGITAATKIPSSRKA